MGLHAFDPTHFGSRRSGGEHPRLLDIKIPTPPAEDPVTLAEAKEWLRVDGTDQDATITALITAATLWAENFTRRSFVERELDVTFARFPAVGVDVYLPGPPTRSLAAITYQDSAGVGQVFPVPDVSIEPLFGLVRVRPGAAESWPQGVFSARFEYTTGYGIDASFVPEEIKTAIKIGLAQMFETRVDQTFGAQASIPQTKASEALLRQFKVGDI